MGQLTILDNRAPHCPFVHRLEEHDNHCFSMGIEKPGYEVLAEDHPDIDEWLAVIRGIDLQNVRALPVMLPDFFNTDFIPTIRRGDSELLAAHKPKFVAIRLEDVVSRHELRVAKNLDRFGLPKGTKPILQCYGSDTLIENLWPLRKEVFAQLAKLGFVAATSVNYSMWDDQPHAERLINIKRGLITFEDWQAAGVPAIPHIYWYGYKDLAAWAEWLRANPDVDVVAINLQTIRSQLEWDQAMRHLAYFVSILKGRPVHFLINGPSSLVRVHELNDLLPSFTLSNAYVTRTASAGQIISRQDDDAWTNYSPLPRRDIFRSNSTLYEQYRAKMRDKYPAKTKNIQRNPSPQKENPAKP